MLKPTRILCIVWLLICHAISTKSQCLTPPPLDSCNGTEAPVIDNETLIAGVKKWYYGATTTFNQLTLSGGTLVVCGDLTVDKFYMDSGTIVVRPGGRFVIGGGIGYGIDFRGNCYVYNYGTFKCVRNLGLNNSWASATKPNVIINATTASRFEMQNQYFVINNPYSFFVNKGKAEFHGIITDPGAAAGSVCLGWKSETRMTVLYNKRKNSYIAPEGTACVNVTEYSQFYDTLTNNNFINFCLGPRHYSDSSCRPWGCKPNAWGNNNIFKICNMCADANLLTLQITDFIIDDRKTSYLLKWKTNLTIGEDTRFTVERSNDGKYFNSIDSIVVTNDNRQSNFAIIDKNPLNGYAYYRVKSVNRFTGRQTSSITQKVFFQNGSITKIYPNPFRSSFIINLKSGEHPDRVEIFSMLGVLIHSYKVHSNTTNNITISFPDNIEAGSYLLKIIGSYKIETKKIFKED